METRIRPVNLDRQREQHKMTQEDLAELLDVTRVQVARIETGKRNISLENSLKCVNLFGYLMVEMDETLYIIKRYGTPDPDNNDPNSPSGSKRHIPDDEELHDLTDAEHNLNVMQQAEDVVRAMQRLVSSPLLLRSDSELSDALRVAKYKELHELDWAIRGRLREGEQTHPHLVEEGLRLALAERPGYPKEVDDIEPAA